jgi:hypothetical protein
MKPRKSIARLVVETFDGRAYTGENVNALVAAMRTGAWACSRPTLGGYMKGVAVRSLRWNKAVIRADDCENFLRDLEAAGFIEVLSIN